MNPNKFQLGPNPKRTHKNPLNSEKMTPDSDIEERVARIIFTHKEKDYREGSLQFMRGKRKAHEKAQEIHALYGEKEIDCYCTYCRGVIKINHAMNSAKAFLEQLPCKGTGKLKLKDIWRKG